MLWTRRARPASGCRRRSLGIETTSARAEAARVGRWWPWLDSNGVTLFVQQYDRGTCCELLLATYKYLVHGTGTWYHTSKYVVRVVSV